MNASLRILQITNRIPFPLNDGGTIATYNVTYYLNASGHKVTLASLNTNKHYQDPAVLEDIATVYTSDIDTTVTAAGLIRGIFSDLPYNIKRFDSPAFKNLLTDIVSNNEFDIIQIEGSYMALYISVLRKHSNASIVLRSHNIEHEIWERMAHNESNRLKSWYFSMLSKKIKRFEDTSMHTFDAVVAITDRDADYYRRQHFNGTLKVINAGADLSKWIPDHTHIEKNTICFLAGLDWMPNQQGLDWFLNQVWPVLKKRFPLLQLHIAGKAMPPHYLQLNDPSIKAHGMVPDAVQYLQKYEIFIVPLLSGGGMRLKVVEGMALGACIVSTSIGAEGVAYTNGKDIQIADSPEEWISALAYLIEHPDQMASIREQAAALAVSKYNWKHLVDTFIMLYRHLLKQQ